MTMTRRFAALMLLLAPAAADGRGAPSFAQEARADKILGELRAAEGAVAKELKGHPALLRQEEALLHQAAARAGEARRAFYGEANIEKKSSALLAEERKATSEEGSGSHAAAQAAQGALLGLASGLESVARDDRSVLAHSGEVAKATRRILGDSVTSRRVQALMSRAEGYERSVMSSDEHAAKEARREARRLRNLPGRAASGAVKLHGEATTPEGFRVGSDEDIQNEVNKMMSEAEAMQARKKAFEAVHGLGTFKTPSAMAQATQTRHGSQDGHKLSMSLAKKGAEANQAGSASDLRSGADRHLHEEEARRHRVALRERAEASKSRSEAEQLGLQKRRGQKHRVHGARDDHAGAQDGAKSYEELSVERRRQARLSIEKAKREHAARQRGQGSAEASAQSRDRRLIQELNAVRRDLVHSLQDGTEVDDGAARTENSLIREAERVLEEARAARQRGLPVALQRGSRAHGASAASAAELASRGAAMAMHASRAAEKEARSEAEILRETRYAEAQIGKLLRAEGAEGVRAEVMKDLEKARQAEKQTIKAQSKEAAHSWRAAQRMAKQARGLAGKA